jgi:hypothetical protein
MNQGQGTMDQDTRAKTNDLHDVEEEQLHSSDDGEE